MGQWGIARGGDEVGGGERKWGWGEDGLGLGIILYFGGGCLGFILTPFIFLSLFYILFLCIYTGRRASLSDTPITSQPLTLQEALTTS